MSISLADMITYPVVAQPPLPSSEQSEHAVSKELCGLLKLVGLEYLSEREGLWDNAKPWGDLLSLGEQQALGIARLLYAKPQYAVLDECLSAVSSQVQGTVFAALAERNIAVVATMHEVSEVAAPYFAQELKLGEAVPTGWSLHQLHKENEGAEGEQRGSASQESGGTGIEDSPSPVAG